MVVIDEGILDEGSRLKGRASRENVEHGGACVGSIVKDSGTCKLEGGLSFDIEYPAENGACVSPDV